MLNSAIELFRAQGIAGTALSDVISHSQSPRGSIYHYFPDGKAQLAAEATARAGHLMNRMITKSMAAAGPTATIAAIIDVFRTQLERTDFASGCPVAAGALEGDGPPAARTAAGEAFSTWEATLADALVASGHPRDRADTLASLVVCSIEGAIIVAKAQRGTRALDRVEAQLLALL